MNERAAKPRVLAYLHELDAGEDGVIRIGESWKSIATEIGLTHEAVYRALRDLANEGIIERPSSRSVRVSAPGLPAT